MRTEVDEVLTVTGGVATRQRLIDRIGRAAFDAEVRSGALTAVFPRAYARPWDADVATIIDRAALTSVGPPAALSHVTGLSRWGLLAPCEVRDVTVPRGRLPRSSERLRIHRTRRFPSTVRLDGLPTTAVAPSLLGGWSELGRQQRRGPVIEAVRRRLAQPDEIIDEIVRWPRVEGRAELSELVGLLAAGCESELEIWGLLSVFDVPGLRHGVRQMAIAVGGRRYRLDLAYRAERVAVEMDGWATHSSRADRERDMRRDAALASIGWLTLRFSYHRLHQDVAGVRREVLATLAARGR